MVGLICFCIQMLSGVACVWSVSMTFLVVWVDTATQLLVPIVVVFFNRVLKLLAYVWPSKIGIACGDLRPSGAIWGQIEVSLSVCYAREFRFSS